MQLSLLVCQQLTNPNHNPPTHAVVQLPCGNHITVAMSRIPQATALEHVGTKQACDRYLKDNYRQRVPSTQAPQPGPVQQANANEPVSPSNVQIAVSL